MSISGWKKWEGRDFTKVSPFSYETRGDRACFEQYILKKKKLTKAAFFVTAQSVFTLDGSFPAWINTCSD